MAYIGFLATNEVISQEYEHDHCGYLETNGGWNTLCTG